MPPSLDRIDHIHVQVADRARAERWYAEVLGLSRMAQLESWATGGGPLTLANASGTIHLALFERAPEPSRSTVAFGVAAAEFVAWRRHLESQLGRPIEAVDHQLAWSIYFADPDGNPYEITTYEHAVTAGLLRTG
jgi:Predicted ring-cleavage extradiol dioxygenase